MNTNTINKSVKSEKKSKTAKVEDNINHSMDSGFLFSCPSHIKKKLDVKMCSVLFTNLTFAINFHRAARGKKRVKKMHRLKDEILGKN